MFAYLCFFSFSAEVRDGEKAQSYTTARTLLAILRLAQALARLRFQNQVALSDVDEVKKNVFTMFFKF